MNKEKNGLSKTGKIGIGLAVIVFLIAICVADGTFTINEQEQAVVTTFGVGHTVTEPGLHFKIPFIQRVHQVNTTIQSLTIGYDGKGNSVDSEAVMITSDFNFVDVDFYLEYRVSDALKAVYASQDPVFILRNVAQSCIRTTISNYDVDSVLTTGKGEIQGRIREMITDQLEQYDIGIQLVNISIQDSEPPTQQVMEAFKNVETAKQGKETSINNANKYRNEQVPIAEADADQILQDAEAQKTKRINEANAQVSMFNAMYEEYEKNPEITRKRMFYEAMEGILPNMTVIIGSDDSSQTMIHQFLGLDGTQASDILKPDENVQN
ncbi:MAG: FtsH protease activity modulator HflK [Parasporobacterium sp.]|nr:FtsH protease activity modulator HflK [Parasporobacterium sp.]